MGGEIVKFGDWISGGWELFTRQWQTWVLAALMHFILLMIPAIFLIIGFYIPVLTHHDPDLVVMVPLIFIMPFIVVGMIFINGGMHRMALKQFRGQTIKFGDVFSGTDCFGRLLIAGILCGLLASCAFCLCILPMYPVLAFLFFTAPLIVDRDMGPVEAMKASYNLVKKDWAMFTLFVFVTGVISWVGANLCYVGLLATYPLMFTITAVAYRDCFGIEGVQTDFRYAIPEASPAIYSAPTPVSEKTSHFISNCPNCNAYMPVSATFCPKCGLKR